MLTEIQLFNKRVQKHEKRIARKKPYCWAQQEASRQFNADLERLRQLNAQALTYKRPEMKTSLLKRVTNFFFRRKI